MTVKLFLLILFSVSFSAAAQLLLKIGMSSGAIQTALASGDSALRTALHVVREPFVLFGLLLYGVGAAVWLLVLARLDVSVAYPFVGLGFILTMALGYLLLNEPVGALRLVGTCLVAVGVVLVARS
jgi:multidrug transporter EmrE-like cation transporter